MNQLSSLKTKRISLVLDSRYNPFFLALFICIWSFSRGCIGIDSDEGWYSILKNYRSSYYSSPSEGLPKGAHRQTFFPSISPSPRPSPYSTLTTSIPPSPSDTSNLSQLSEYSSWTPSFRQTKIPSGAPSKYPSIPPSFKPSNSPTGSPSSTPTGTPSFGPSAEPSETPSHIPSSTPSMFYTTNNPSISQKPSNIFAVNSQLNYTSGLTFRPGLLNIFEQGLILSEGLSARIIATSGHPVVLEDGVSDENFIMYPDAAGVFSDPNPSNEGGWIYTINSEVRVGKDIPVVGAGGVAAFTFDSTGNIIDYRIVLKNTTCNCGGGKTPWGSWVSCEEYPDGQIWQVDPTGQRPSQLITMGMNDPGYYESFAYDVRDQDYPHFFVTKDEEDGEIRRFTPENPDWNEPWNMLLGNGALDYLVLFPESDDQGRFTWSSNLDLGKANAKAYFPHTEGIDVYNNELFFVTKIYKSLFILDLDNHTYKNSTTKSGLFNGQPDQIERIVGTETTSSTADNFVYFTEDDGKYAGIHGRDVNGKYYTMLESDVYLDETTGLSFSPDNKHMYFAYQESGILFDITRTDGLPFGGKHLDIKYHDVK